MIPMAQVMAEHTQLSPADRAWLTSLVREWHLLADVSFSDLVLWVPDVDDNVFWAAAQIRPTTGPTALEDPVVGDDISYDPESMVTTAYLSHEIVSTSEHNPDAGIPVAVWAIPIIRHGDVIGVVERHLNEMGVRAPGALEDNYLAVAKVLSRMLWHAAYPVEPRSDPSISPRVGDGLIVLDSEGICQYISPNAVSAWRRLGVDGDLLGADLEEIVERIDLSEPLSHVEAVNLGEAVEFNIETRDAAVRVRVLPLECTESLATLVLCRDISDIRDRDRELVTKDATIREIHHRVKNNLQTVAALLRLQSRRTKSSDARGALSDAMRRVQSIAAVHEILSQSYDEQVAFDDVADRILQMVGDVASTGGHVTARREGSFGWVPADVATALSLVMTELCQNGIEHGLQAGSGELLVRSNGDTRKLVLEVIDDGQGLPAGFSIANLKSLGMSIVSTLIKDLGGQFSIHNNDAAAPFASGSTAVVVVPLEKPQHGR